MNLTVKLKLLPTQYQIDLLNQITTEYIAIVNNLVSAMVEAQSFLKLTSKDVYTDRPSAVKNQAIQDAKSVYNWEWPGNQQQSSGCTIKSNVG